MLHEELAWGIDVVYTALYGEIDMLHGGGNADNDDADADKRMRSGAKTYRTATPRVATAAIADHQLPSPFQHIQCVASVF